MEKKRKRKRKKRKNEKAKEEHFGKNSFLLIPELWKHQEQKFGEREQASTRLNFART